MKNDATCFRSPTSREVYDTKNAICNIKSKFKQRIFKHCDLIIICCNVNHQNFIKSSNGRKALHILAKEVKN